MDEEKVIELAEAEIEESPEQVEETEPTSEDEISEPEVEEEEIIPEPKTVPIDALQDERRKRQELERKLDGLEKGMDSLKDKAQPKDIFEAYDRDSSGVMRDLNSEIQKLSSDNAYENAPQIERLRDLKDDLRKREFTNLQQNLNRQTEAQKVLSEIVREIPDFQKKTETLTEFAIEELGYTKEELIKKTDFALGEDARREVTRINRLYEKFNAKPEKKVVKQRPTSVESGGKGVQKTEPNLQQLLERATETGNWEEYFEAKGLL